LALRSAPCIITLLENFPHGNEEKQRLIQKSVQPMVSKFTFPNWRKLYFQTDKLIVITAFLAFFLLGLAIVRDYGIHWDEPAWRQTGHIFLKGLLAKDTAFLTNPNRYAGTGFEMVAAAAENFFRVTQNDRNAYFLRHTLVFLTFFLGSCFFYKLSLNIFKDWRWSLTGCVLLVASPRIFADSFYNSKDIPFLAFFILSMYTLMEISRQVRQPRPPAIVCHGMVCAFLAGIRTFGLIVFIITVLMLLFQRPCKKALSNLLILTITYVVTCLILFPVLWHKPIQQLAQAVTMIKPHPWLSEVLYNGDFIRSDQLPWHYSLHWVLITTPVSYLLFFITGFIQNIVSIFQRERGEKQYLVFGLLWFWGPLLIAFIFNRGLYDGWRHFFFIYPAFILISVQGFKFLWNSVQWLAAPRKSKIRYLVRGLLLAILLTDLSGTIYFMVRYHPFQNVYFNRIAGKDLAEIKKKFELDYWGLSYRQALESITRSDPRPEIFIYSANPPGKMNASILPPADRRRLVFVEDIRAAEYFITNYRWQNFDILYPGKIFSVSVRGTDIVSVFKKM